MAGVNHDKIASILGSTYTKLGSKPDMSSASQMAVKAEYAKSQAVADLIAANAEVTKLIEAYVADERVVVFRTKRALKLLRVAAKQAKLAGL